MTIVFVIKGTGVDRDEAGTGRGGRAGGRGGQEGEGGKRGEGDDGMGKKGESVLSSINEFINQRKYFFDIHLSSFIQQIANELK